MTGRKMKLANKHRRDNMTWCVNGVSMKVVIKNVDEDDFIEEF